MSIPSKLKSSPVDRLNYPPHETMQEDNEDDRGSVNPDEDDDTMDSSSSTNWPQPTSNLVAPDSLKKTSFPFNDGEESTSSNVFPDQNNKEDTVTIDDYIKDSKTLNVNVLEGESHMNNELNFDSEKFSKQHENLRPKETIDNLCSSEGDGLDKLLKKKGESAKRFKDTNIINGGDITEAKTNGNSSIELEFNGIKRMRLDSSDKEKNVQLELERRQNQELQSTTSSNVCLATDAVDDLTEVDEDGEIVVNGREEDEDEEGIVHGASALPLANRPQDSRSLKEAIEADRYWEKYLAANDTVIARTFQV